jgi:energy-coupling factor transporter ATP-binding protein EcfA2
VSGPAADPGQLLEQAGRWVDALRGRGLAAETVMAQVEEMLARSRGERLDRPDDPLLVAMLCGPTAVGKSSLINALAGAEISRPGLGANTSAAIVYAHERDDPARLFEYGEALGRLGGEAANLVRHSRDELLHKVLVDTPDIDSVARHHRDMSGVLVHCADLVLFVTSLEKYKDMRSACWVAEQRRQRAVAFVLNKWDRAAFGPHYDRRHLVAQDFLSLLIAEGFRDPLIFKVSALPAPLAQDRENELPALRAWLAEGLDRSAAAAIQERRRRAAWGRLGAAITAAVPLPLSDHPLAGEAADRLAEARAQARRMVESEALALVPGGLDRSLRPVTPGLLGGWIKLTGAVGMAAAPVRRLFVRRAAARRPQQGETASAAAASDFGRPAAALFARTTADLARDAEAAHLPLGPVGAAWTAEARRLGQRLAPLPAEVEADLAANALRPSLRRWAGTALLFTVEALLFLVLLIALWRIGSGFVLGNYLPAALLVNALALIVALILIGQLVASFFFPALQERLRRAVAARAESLIDEAWRRAQGALTEQLDAAARLTRQGHELLEDIEGVIRSLVRRDEAGAGGVERLFGEGAPSAADREPAGVTEESDPVRNRPARRPPKFD